MKHINLRKIILALLLAVMALALTACGSKSIDLTDYIVVGEVEGLNGHGTAVCTLDSDALFAAISSQQPDGSGSFLQQIAVLDEAFSHITVTAEPCENLFNGDTVAVTAVYDAPKDLDIGCKIKNGKTTFKVEGLADGQAIDLFAEDAIVVKFAGMSGSGMATVEVISTELVYQNTEYTLSAATNLSNGDEVVLTAAVRDSLLAEMGHYAETTEKTYTVSGLGEPFTTADKLSAADKTRLEELALAKAKAEAEDWYSYMKLTAATCTGIYGYDGRVWDSWNGLDSYGGVVALASCDFGADGEYPMAVFFQNCGKDGNGTLSFSEEDIVTMSKKIATTDVLSWLKSTFPEAVFTELG